MANITFIEASGQSTSVNLPDGWSLMQGATANGVDGILGECGGSCACATCHCYVADDLMAKVLPASDTELAMLDNVAERAPPQQPPGLPDQGQRRRWKAWWCTCRPLRNKPT
jgi:2Fe-2S ferredoxin